MRLLYIAGPFTAPTLEQQERNVRAAEAAAHAVATECSNVYPVVPHSLGLKLPCHGAFSDYHYAGTLRLMEACHAVLLIPGWERSLGAVREADRAAELGMPVFRLEHGVLAAIHQWAKEEVSGG